MSAVGIRPVVDLHWLEARRDDVVLADVRWYPDGRDLRAEFERGHLPGATLVELESVCAAPPSAGRGRHPLPSPTAFAESLVALGIGDRRLVVGYDDQGGVLAARLVWMLRALGREAALLDAGPGPFPETGAGPISEQDAGPERQPAAADRTPAQDPADWPPELLAEIDETAAIAAGSGIVIDARPRDRYQGAPDALDPRAGHIPGVRSLPCREHLGSDGYLLGVDDLRRRFAAVGIDGDSGFVSSCGSGVTACHNLLVAEHAGLGRGRLFPGSWSQWSRAPERPAAAGPEPSGG